MTGVQTCALPICYDVEDRRAKLPKHYQKGLQPLSVINSLLSLTGDNSQEKKKFQSHLRFVLPQIYTESYFRDPILLPALIAKAEFSLREGWSLFPRLQFDFEFLTLIQFNGENTLKQIKDSVAKTDKAKMKKLLDLELIVQMGDDLVLTNLGETVLERSENI